MAAEYHRVQSRQTNWRLTAGTRPAPECLVQLWHREDQATATATFVEVERRGLKETAGISRPL